MANKVEIENLPKEIIEQIFDYLPDFRISELSRLSRVCKTWKKICSGDNLWIALYDGLRPGECPKDMNVKEFLDAHRGYVLWGERVDDTKGKSI